MRVRLTREYVNALYQSKDGDLESILHGGNPWVSR